MPGRQVACSVLRFNMFQLLFGARETVDPLFASIKRRSVGQMHSLFNLIEKTTQEVRLYALSGNAHLAWSSGAHFNGATLTFPLSAVSINQCTNQFINKSILLNEEERILHV